MTIDGDLERGRKLYLQCRACHSLKEKEIGVLITDHNVRETLSITDRSYLLFDGQILKSGSSEFLANDEEARRLYLGEKFKLD